MPQPELDENQLLDRIREIAIAGGKYPFEAFLFVQVGVVHAVSFTHGDKVKHMTLEERHITGPQVCLGLRDLAWLHWGFLASTVLASWNIRETFDFGRIVYALIDSGLLSKQPHDSIDDFASVYTVRDIERSYAIPTGFVEVEAVGKLMAKSKSKAGVKLGAQHAGQPLKSKATQNPSNESH